MVNQISFGPSGIDSRADFAPLTQLGQIYQKAQQDQANKQAFAQYQATGDPSALLASGDMNLARLGTELARNKVMDTRDARDFGFRQQSHADTINQQNRAYALAEKKANEEPPTVQVLRAAGLDPNSPEGRKALFPKTDTPISAVDKKTITTAEDELPAIEGTITSLKRALELNDKTFTGQSAGLRGQIGTSGIPGSNLLIDKNAALATREWQTHMSGEAIAAMSDQLKGATTDFELKSFEKRLADPATPPSIRKTIIERMLTLADKQRAIKARRIEELRTGTYYKPGGAGTTAPPPAARSSEDAAAADWAAANPNDPRAAAIKQRLGIQ